ncbi:hypothetical protein AB0B66_32220 [Catellatospora sp. NPDC049111]|uniref:hypothetical protein n=1 Tax=Catellatospora sp. NPDC049111 TaxID=3155271 RepID=UPI0033EE5035
MKYIKVSSGGGLGSMTSPTDKWQEDDYARRKDRLERKRNHAGSLGVIASAFAVASLSTAANDIYDGVPYAFRALLLTCITVAGICIAKSYERYRASLWHLDTAKWNDDRQAAEPGALPGPERPLAQYLRTYYPECARKYLLAGKYALIIAVGNLLFIAWYPVLKNFAVLG